MTSVIGDILVVNKINADDLTSAKFNQICRCCLSEGQMHPIFETNIRGTTFTELLKFCSSLKIEKSDPLPQNVCAICLKKVVELHSFKEQCSTSESILKDVLCREYLKYQTCNLENKIVIPKEEVKSIEENSCGEFNFHDEYLAKPSPVSISEIYIAGVDKIDVTKEEVIEIAGQNCVVFEQNTVNIELENAVREKQRKPRIRKKTSNVQVKSRKVITPKLPYKRLQKKSQSFKFTCRICKATFESKEDFRAHRIKEKHPLRENQLCKVCGIFVVFGKSREHMKTHSALKLYQCDICSKRFGFVHNLKRHKMIHTNERPHKCQICEKAFVQKVNLDDHIVTHTGEKRYVCHHCGKAFMYQQSLKCHLSNVHTESVNSKEAHKQPNFSKKVQCGTCQKICSSKVALRVHQVTHGEKKFMCSHCGKSFYSKASLNSHLKVHTKEKPYKCPTCPKSFSHVGNLKLHILTHTGEKPFVCEVCNRGFAQPSQVKSHMRTHSGERPYKCTYCSKSFALNGNLTIHLRLHSGEKPYVCDVCKKAFHDSGYLRKHKCRRVDI